jgi:hypothetical protein
MLVHHGDQSADASDVMVGFMICVSTLFVPFGSLVIGMGGFVVFLAFFFIPKRLSAPV